MKRLPLLLLGVVLILVGTLVASLVTADRLRDERDAARTSLVGVRRQLSSRAADLRFANHLTESYQQSDEQQRVIIRGLRSQIEWDKSHLLDCWTALVRVLPRARLERIFPTAEGTWDPVAAARRGGSLRRYIGRCASDAVP
jgi:hypothetical protein